MELDKDIHIVSVFVFNYFTFLGVCIFLCVVHNAVTVTVTVTVTVVVTIIGYFIIPCSIYSYLSIPIRIPIEIDMMYV